MRALILAPLWLSKQPDSVSGSFCTDNSACFPLTLNQYKRLFQFSTPSCLNKTSIFHGFWFLLVAFGGPFSNIDDPSVNIFDVKL